MKTPLSPSKFKAHIHKETLEFITYLFKDMNRNSSISQIVDYVADVRKKTGGIVDGRTFKRKGYVEIYVNLPTRWVIDIDPEE